MKKGFTLVELSIVLVIIGLLIGGILAAQSMVETARVNKIIKEAEQLQIAFRLFKQRYSQLPGDYDKQASFGAANGNGNGAIECGWTEQVNAFYVLSRAGFLQTNLQPQTCCHSNVIPNETVYQSTSFKDMHWVVGSVSGTFGSGPVYTDICTRPAVINQPEDQTGDNYFSITRNYTTAPSVGTSVYGFQPPFLKAIDAKFDDGRASSGNFRVGSGLQGANWQWCVTNAGEYLDTDIAQGIEPQLGCAGAFKLINN